MSCELVKVVYVVCGVAGDTKRALGTWKKHGTCVLKSIGEYKTQKGAGATYVRTYGRHTKRRVRRIVYTLFSRRDKYR